MRTQCGAKTRTGAPCKAPARENGRCRIHGSSGAKPGNTNSPRKHGIYARVIREDQQESAAAMRANAGNVDDELVIVRLQLEACLEAQNNARENDHHGLELQKFHDRETTEMGPGDEHVYERVDYGAHIDRLTARIGALEKLRAELIEMNGSGNDTNDMTKTDTFIAPDEPIPEKPIL